MSEINENLNLEVTDPVTQNLDLEAEEAQDVPAIILNLDMQDGASVKSAEAWAVGQRGGVDVPSTDVTYHNNAKYYSEETAAAIDDIVVVQDATPTAQKTKVWMPATAPSGVQVPTYAEHQAVEATLAKVTPTNTGTQGQILRNNGQGGAVWTDAATAEEVATAAEAWLNDHVSQGETLAIDNTLTLSGYAGDAKVTGDKISELKSALNALQAGEFDGDRHIAPFVNGSYTTSPIGLTGVKNRIRPETFISVKNGDIISISNGAYKHSMAIWKGSIDSPTIVRSDNTWVTTDEDIAVKDDGFFIITFADAQNTSQNIDPSVFDGNIIIPSYAKNKIGDTNDFISTLSGCEYEKFVDGKYISLNGDTASSTPTNDVTMEYCIVECKEGDVFSVRSGAQNARAWGFVDDSNPRTILKKEDANVVCEGQIVAPANAKYLIVNSLKSYITDPYLFRGNINRNAVQNKNKLKSYETGKYIRLDEEYVTLAPPLSDNNSAYCLIECSAGEEFYVNARGQNQTRAWCFADADKKVLSVAASNTLYRCVIKAPVGAKYLISDNSTLLNPDYYLAPIETISEVISSNDENRSIVVHFEKGKYDSSAHRLGGPYTNWPSNMINKYPIVLGNNATNIIFPKITQTTKTTFKVYFRNANGVTVQEMELLCSKVNTISVPDNSFYIDIMIEWTGLYDIAILIRGGDEPPVETKRIYTNGTDKTVNYFEVDRSVDEYTALCYMMPPNYSYNGEKVPLIVWFDGNGNYMAPGNTFNSTKLPGLSYVRDEGYAVVQIYSWGTKYYQKYPDCGWDQPYPVPTCLKCIKAGIEYICDRYNVDPDNVHVMSKSMGGIISTHFISDPVWNFKSIGMFAPAIDVLALNGRCPDARHAIADDLQFQDDDLSDFFDISIDGTLPEGEPNFYRSPRCQHIWLNNMGGLIRLNSAWRMLVGGTSESKYQSSLSDARAWHENFRATGIYDDTGYAKIAKIPVKIWSSVDDLDIPHQKVVELIAQLKNSGIQAELETLEQGSHSAWDVVSDAERADNVQDITTRLGISHTDIPNGWIENVRWVILNSLKLPSE